MNSCNVFALVASKAFWKIIVKIIVKIICFELLRVPQLVITI